MAQVACDMLLLLTDHAERLRRPLPEVPKKIIEVKLTVEIHLEM